VDTIGASQTGAIALQWHTHVQYLMDMPLLYLDGALVVQRAAMQALAPGDQAIVRDELEAVFRQLNQLSREDDTAAREALRSNGITVVRPTLEETGPWRDAVAAAMDRLSTQGVYSAALLQRLRGYLADYRKLATSSR
jgi:TRAP-type C4-dicarboxylate transport system substrate-binding protein